MLRRLLPFSLALALTGSIACSGSEPAPEPAVDPAAEAGAAEAALLEDIVAEAEAENAAIEAEETKPVPTVNLNTATPEQIKAGVPGISDKMVHEFEEYRPYVSIQQFRKEMGKYVGLDEIEKFETYVFVPIDPNACDAATLAQIRGVDEHEAEALVAKRPFADRDAFLNALVETVEEPQYLAAKGMLVP